MKTNFNRVNHLYNHKRRCNTCVPLLRRGFLSVFGLGELEEVASSVLCWKWEIICKRSTWHLETLVTGDLLVQLVPFPCNSFPPSCSPTSQFSVFSCPPPAKQIRGSSMSTVRQTAAACSVTLTLCCLSLNSAARASCSSCNLLRDASRAAWRLTTESGSADGTHTPLLSHTHL